MNGLAYYTCYRCGHVAVFDVAIGDDAACPACGNFSMMEGEHELLTAPQEKEEGVKS